MHYLDFIGAALGVICTLLLIRASIYAWPVGIVAIVLNSILYQQNNLFADMSLQALYLAMFVYGWYFWSRKGGKDRDQQQINTTPIKHISPQHALLYAALSVIAIALISVVLSYYTRSTTPLWDASTTVIAVLAQWLTCRKVIQNWLLWLFNDSLYAGLYLHKNLPFHALEHGIYVIMAVVGFINWYRIMRQQSANSNTSSGLYAT